MLLVYCWGTERYVTDQTQSLGQLSQNQGHYSRQNKGSSARTTIGGKFIAREDLSGYRKDVTAKLYGGDVTRRKKPLEKQKRGKARMKRFGTVDIPAEAFTVMLKRD